MVVLVVLLQAHAMVRSPIADAAVLDMPAEKPAPAVAAPSDVSIVGFTGVADEQGENVICEVDDFAQVSGPALMGMAEAGHEEQVIRQLHKAGSIDASAILPDVQAVMQEESK